jgi:CRISPR-associated protein Cas1
MYLDLECKLPYAYVEMGRLYVKESSLRYINENTDVVIPVGRVGALFLGPGVTITHSAIKMCSWVNCTVVWVGEDISKCYAVSSCHARSSENLLKQIRLYERKKPLLIKRYCKKRFGKVFFLGKINEDKIRGLEGSYMKKIYVECAKKYGIPWNGRMKHGEWDKQTLYNKAISICNSYLYGICCSVLNALGYSPALGLLHTGDMLSLVFDIADLYKMDLSIPLGFEIARDYRDKKIPDNMVEKELRKRALVRFKGSKLLTQILTDIEDIFDGNLHSEKHKEQNQACTDCLFL